MPQIERCEVTTVGARLVYGRDHDDTSERRQQPRRVCFRRSDDLVVQEGEVVALEYTYEQRGNEQLPTMLVNVSAVRSQSP